MYRDREKQKQAVKEANRRYRAKHKGITQDDTVIPQRDTRNEIPEEVTPEAEPEPQSYNPLKVGYIPPRI